MKRSDRVIKKGNTYIDLDNNVKIKAMLVKLRSHPYEMLDYEDFKDIGLTENTFKSYISILTTYSDGIYRIAKGCKPAKYIYLPKQSRDYDFEEMVDTLVYIQSMSNDIVNTVRDGILRFGNREETDGN
jgi:hypothetical protein